MAIKTAAEINASLDTQGTAKTTQVVKEYGIVSGNVALYYVQSINDVHGAAGYVSFSTAFSTATAAAAIVSALPDLAP